MKPSNFYRELVVVPAPNVNPELTTTMLIIFFAVLLYKFLARWRRRGERRLRKFKRRMRRCLQEHLRIVRAAMVGFLYYVVRRLRWLVGARDVLLDTHRRYRLPLYLIPIAVERTNRWNARRRRRMARQREELLRVLQATN